MSNSEEDGTKLTDKDGRDAWRRGKPRPAPGPARVAWDKCRAQAEGESVTEQSEDREAF